MRLLISQFLVLAFCTLDGGRGEWSNDVVEVRTKHHVADGDGLKEISMLEEDAVDNDLNSVPLAYRVLLRVLSIPLQFLAAACAMLGGCLLAKSAAMRFSMLSLCVVVFLSAQFLRTAMLMFFVMLLVLMAVALLILSTIFAEHYVLATLFTLVLDSFVIAIAVQCMELRNLQWSFYYVHYSMLVASPCAIVLASGIGALSLGLYFVVHEAALASYWEIVVTAVTPGIGCALVSKAFSMWPFGASCAFCGVVANEDARIWTATVDGLDLEPLWVFLGLICELAVVQSWRTAANMKERASLALLSGWLGLATCDISPAFVIICKRGWEVGQLARCLFDQDVAHCWGYGKYLRAIQTVCAAAFFFAGACSVRAPSQAKASADHVNVCINFADLTQIDADLRQPVLGRTPSRRTKRRLAHVQSQMLQEARTAKRRRVEVGLVRSLWSVNHATELYELLRPVIDSRLRTNETWYIKVRRRDVLQHALQSFHAASIEQLLAVNIKVRFKGEPGIDAGGLKRDFFTSVGRALATSHLLVPGPDEGLVPQPLPAERESLSTDLLASYEAIGRFLAVALLQRQQVPLHFNRTTYKMLLGHEVTVHDIQAVDPQFFEHRIQALLDDGGVDRMEAALLSPLCFMSAETKLRPTPEPLISDGGKIKVTESNKVEYVKLLCKHYVLGGIMAQIECILKGFHEVLPLQALRALSLDAGDLGLLLAGVPEIDVADWRRHAQVSGGSPEVQEWFWEIVQGFDHVQRARLLAFATGTARLPIGGFSEIGFKLDFDGHHPDRLPVAHTCANSLRMPVTGSLETMKQKLEMIIAWSDDLGFGFR